MEQIGIDLRSRKSDLCIVDEQGVVVDRAVVQTCRLAGWIGRRQLASPRVVMESSARPASSLGTYGRWAPRSG